MRNKITHTKTQRGVGEREGGEDGAEKKAWV